MKESIKKKWIKALRSGKYKQTRGCLRRELKGGEHGYCCLGVLTDLYMKEKNRTLKKKKVWKRVEPDEDEDDNNNFSLNGEDMTLPREVRKWAGTTRHDPNLHRQSKNGRRLDPKGATTLNDDLKYNFEKIADCLEVTHSSML